MELNYMREFVALAQSCQFQETAEELFISQSTLSKHIKAIEKELGAELFVRSTRRVELSETGKAFLSYAAQIARLQQDYTDELVRASSTKKIRIGSDPTISLRQLEKCFSTYIMEHPNIRLELSEHDKNMLRSMLRKGEYDLIVGCRDISDTDSDFFSYPYYAEELVAVLSSSHPLAGKESLNINDIKAYPIAQQGSINFGQYLDPTIAEAQYKSVRGSLITQLLNITNCVSICPSNGAAFVVSNDLAKDLIIVPIEPKSTINVDIICLKTRKNSPFIQTIIDHVDPGAELLKNEYRMVFSKPSTTIY